MKKLTGALLLSAMAMLTACNTTNNYNGGSTYYSGGGTVDPAYYGWYNVYGSECGTLKPGCNYWSDGLKIVDVEDPYYSGPYVWNNYYDYYYGQYVWESPSGLIYDQYGNCLNRANGGNIQRDLVTIVSNEEAKTIEKAAAGFAKKYSLSAEVSMKVARSFNDWAKLGFKRGSKGRTDADLADFTKRLYGVDIKKVGTAILSASLGDSSSLNSTVSEVASNWNTSPETMKEILKDFHGKQLEAAGVSLE